MTTRRDRTAVFKIKTIQSPPYAAISAAPGAPRTAYDQPKPSKPKEQPDDITVLLVGLPEETEGLVRDVLGDVTVESMRAGYVTTDVDAVRGRILAHAAHRMREQNTHRQSYNLVIADAETVDPYQLNFTAKDWGGRLILLGTLPPKVKADVDELLRNSHSAETPAELETELRKYKAA